MKRVFLLAIIIVSLLSVVSATTTSISANQTQFTVNPGSTGAISVSYQINNTGGVGAKGVVLTGSPRFVTYSGSPISFDVNTTTSGSITLNYLIPLNAVQGVVVNSVIIDEQTIDFTFNVQVQQQQNLSPILVFPTSKIITVKQGDEKTQNILITVPSSYPRTITIQSVDFNPNVETIKFGDLNLGLVAPGQSIQIPIIFSGINAQTGTYQTQLSIFAIDSQGQVTLPSVGLQLQVSAGISPTVNFSLSELPTCSLNTIELNLNMTASMTCSRPNPNIEIFPVIDSFYLKGVSVDQTSSQFIYNFQAKKIGNTKVIAEFKYQNSPIGNPFEQEVRISPSGSSPIPGTVIDLLFYQEGSQTIKSSLAPKETIIQVVDNQTKSLVNSYKMYLGGLEINNTLTLEAGRNYDFRVTSPGYLDLTTSFNVSKTQIIITINPVKTYVVGDSLNITTNPENATLYLNGIVITSPYILTTSGNHLLKAEKSGYLTTEMNLSVGNLIEVNSVSPIYDDWKKGKDVTMKLSQSDIWNITFEKKNGDLFDSAVIISNGVGDSVSFKIEELGRYKIYSGGSLVTSQLVEKGGIIKWIQDNWFWSVLGAIVIVLGYFLFFRGEKEESGQEALGYGG